MASYAEVAACLMEHLCNHSWHGYTWDARWGDGEGYCSVEVDGVTYQIAQGDRDCSSSIISCYQAAGLDVNATYTGNMRAGFLATGLFEWHDMSFTAQRGDIYLNEECHTAMCLSDSPDTLGEFCINENGGVYGGQTGDQTGGESHVTSYYNYPWDGILHFIGGEAGGGEREVTGQPDTNPVNNNKFFYRAHVANLGWLDSVRDGMTAGTVGNGYQMEALKMTPPEGMELTVKLHISDVGWKTYKGISRGESSGEGSSTNDPLMGSTGKSRGIQAIEITPTKNPKKLKISYRVHVGGYGWGPWISAGYTAGTTGISHNIEAIEIKAE